MKVVDISHERFLRLACFAGTLLVMAALEAAFPRRPRSRPRGERWPANLVMVLVGAALVRGILPLVPVETAGLASQKGWGLLNHGGLPAVWTWGLSIVALDAVIYLQHVLTHAVPTLWRLHMVHHADLDLDTTTGVRFHPVEILLSAGLKTAAVAALGPPVGAVILFEILLNGTALFNHANLKLPAAMDRAVRLVLVTPDMHRVHHSVIIRETHSNFGFCLSWWDRLFGTYKDQPEKGHGHMTIGLSQFRDPRGLSLARLLVLPVTGDPGRQPINRH
ncbi:Sterol desaturase/sphingolipid hydroxylase, fatty acid hydroxylase superfamily [Desulfacinum hydrothermale DSM 13146]|uniref:Sterol desaturase/sphingolipid hydroxylase, fatty acid hydroxylase superfamily n=1 Tax=Desulfacinum hydrothermale DSM 13146 TaxID=1121390 RepID=A0A1W1XEG2_9BACT|nr:sterol desaturase family protein [Desulfacinum hydrothermale]SMC22303.1 Sterol desaturase/sphingolipid hydroxylase, fatty acid hydroxylase superfamily [Desulfacinum hydrothermale DSM 13146]